MAKFGSGLIVIKKTWSELKSALVEKNANLQYDELTDKYEVFFLDDSIVYLSLIYKGKINGVKQETQDANDYDLYDFENNYKSTCNGKVISKTPVTIADSVIPVSLDGKKTADGNPIFVSEKPDLSRLTIISHDWTDPTTWYETATRVVDEIAINTGNNKKYKLAHNYIIDTYHGKLSKEDYLKSSTGYSYRVIVKVNNVIKTEQDPHYGVGGDFIIDYEDGYVNFINELSVNDEVKVTYHYMVNSVFTFKPPSGKKIKLLMAEVQFSDDVVLTDSIVFQPRGKVDVFAPQYTPIPYPSGTLIPLENPTIYKAFSDFQNDAIRTYPKCPAIGGDNWRAAQHDIIIFNWDYVASAIFRSDYGMEIQIRLQHDTPLQGWYATTTFYCSVETL